jgi:hypothetical protein
MQDCPLITGFYNAHGLDQERRSFNGHAVDVWPTFTFQTWPGKIKTTQTT